MLPVADRVTSPHEVENLQSDRMAVRAQGKGGFVMGANTVVHVAAVASRHNAHKRMILEMVYTRVLCCENPGKDLFQRVSSLLSYIIPGWEATVAWKPCSRRKGLA